MVTTLNLLLSLLVFGFIIGPILRVSSNSNDKFIFKIYLKKDKKFEGKKDPIYEIKLKNVFKNRRDPIYVIEKYELGWHHYRFSTWLYPINIVEWEYIIVDTMNIGSEDLLKTLNIYMKSNSITLREHMENCLKIERDFLEKEKKDENSIENILIKHNKEFSENFVK